MPDEVPVLVTEVKIETQTASWRSDSARAKPTNAPVVPSSASWYGMGSQEQHRDQRTHNAYNQRARR